MFKTHTRLDDSRLKEIHNILIIQQKPFGDILLNTAYLPALRQRFPDAQIDYLIERPYVTILEDNPHLDNLVVMEKAKGKGLRYFVEQLKAARRVRKRGYDLIIDQLRGTSSARMVIFSGAKYRLGWDKKRWNFIYNVRIPQAPIRYKSLYKFDLLAPLGIETKEHNLEYRVKETSTAYIQKWFHDTGLDGKKIVVFSAGTPVKRKQWDLDSYAVLGDKIQNETNFRVILLWGPGEKEDALHIRDKMETTAIMAPSTTFNEAGALLNFTHVLITNDGGINHLAVSQNTPSISIFGPTSSPAKWCPRHRKEYLYLKDYDFSDFKDNTFNISPNQVFDKFQALLALLDEDNSSSMDATF